MIIDLPYFFLFIFLVGFGSFVGVQHRPVQIIVKIVKNEYSSTSDTHLIRCNTWTQTLKAVAHFRKPTPIQFEAAELGLRRAAIKFGAEGSFPVVAESVRQ